MKRNFLILVIWAVAIWLIPGCTRQPGSMGGWGHMMGYGGYGGVFMWLILVIIAGVIAYIVLNQNKKTGNPNGSSTESSREILNKRYARGEITKEEFDRLKKDIEG